jgi:predicted transcriptional regulator
MATVSKKQAMRELVKSTIARQLTAHLTIRRETPTEFARRSGVPLHTVWACTKGRHVPSAVALFKMATSLGIPVDGLVR